MSFGNHYEIEEQLNSTLNLLLLECPPLKTEVIYLVFTNRFTEDIIQFQIENDLKERGHSDGAVGKAFHVIDDDGIKKNYVFLQLDRFSKVLNSRITDCYIELSLIIHEIGHIYDGEQVDKLFPHTFDDFKGITRLQIPLYHISKNAWLEFKANDFVGNSLKAYRHLEFGKKLLDVYGSFAIELIKDIMKFNDRVELAKTEVVNTSECLEIQNLTNSLFYFSSQVFGLIHGVANYLNTAEIYEALVLELEKYGLSKIFMSLVQELIHLQASYGNWEDYKVLDKLCALILDFWKELGFKVDDKLYFSLLNISEN